MPVSFAFACRPPDNAAWWHTPAYRACCLSVRFLGRVPHVFRCGLLFEDGRGCGYRCSSQYTNGVIVGAWRHGSSGRHEQGSLEPSLGRGRGWTSVGWVDKGAGGIARCQGGCGVGRADVGWNFRSQRHCALAFSMVSLTPLAHRVLECSDRCFLYSYGLNSSFLAFSFSSTPTQPSSRLSDCHMINVRVNFRCRITHAFAAELEGLVIGESVSSWC